jgi:hypothetical protein
LLVPINPLYKNFDQELKRQAKRDFDKTVYGRLLKGMNTLERRGSGPVTVDKVNKLIDKYGRGFDPKRVSKEISNTEVARLTKSLEQYAKKGGVSKLAVDYLMKELGPIGSILKAAFGAKAKAKPETQQLAAAQKLLEAFGYTVLPKKSKSKRPPRRSGARGKRAGTTSAAMSRGIERAREWLKSAGYDVPADPEALEEERTKTVFPQGQTGYTTKGDPRRVIDVEVEGRRRRFPVDHPMMTGQMQPATGSSNVHSYSYDLDARTLYVRYLGAGPKGKRAGKGSLYAYYNVPPPIFEGMLKSGSKGQFVWHQLRDGEKQPGQHSLHSHFYNYRLVGVENDYVPRKAMLGGFAKRTILTSRDRELSSSSGRRGANLSPPPINRGTPNRGTPNRG